MKVGDSVKYIKKEEDEPDKEHLFVWYPPYGTVGVVKQINEEKRICEVLWEDGVKNSPNSYWCYISDCEVIKNSEMEENKMKYERLTKQDWHNAKFSINTGANNRIFLHRLWVLENHIENFGTLPDKRDYNRITDRRDSPLVMSQWAGSPDDLAIYNRLWKLENRIEQKHKVQELIQRILARRKR